MQTGSLEAPHEVCQGGLMIPSRPYLYANASRDSTYLCAAILFQTDFDLAVSVDRWPLAEAERLEMSEEDFIVQLADWSDDFAELGYWAAEKEKGRCHTVSPKERDSARPKDGRGLL